MEIQNQKLMHIVRIDNDIKMSFGFDPVHDQHRKEIADEIKEHCLK